MTTSNSGLGSARRASPFCVAAALALALSGCGGGGSSATVPTAANSGAQQPTPIQSSAPAQAPTPAPSADAAQSTAAASATPGPATPPTANIGSVTLQWMPPTRNTDGTPLNDLAGYRIHYGSASGRYTQTINVANPGIATYVVEDLPPGTYYFSVAAVNAQGTVSPMSAEVRTTVN